MWRSILRYVRRACFGLAHYRGRHPASQQGRHTTLGGSKTGFYRDGCCNTGPDDLGAHVVCAVVTEDFLSYSSDRGNDLSTPRPEFGFAGLKPGDRWCLCAARFLQAHEEGVAPKVHLAATHARALDIVPRAVLEAHRAD